MRIAVCIKTVVDPQARIEVDDRGELSRERLRYEVNEYDLYAVEQAIRMADEDGGDVTLVTLGGDDAVQGLRKGLAMGADEAIHVRCDADSLDAAGTARLLAAALRERRPELILAGVESDDLGGSQVGGLLAEELGYACTTLAVATMPEGDTIRVRRELEGGDHAVVRVELPAVLTIQTGINEPRYPSLKGIMAAKRKQLETVDPADLGFDELPAARVERLDLAPPPARERARIIEGSTKDAVAELLRILRQEEKVL